jgi:hypothetical protein
MPRRAVYRANHTSPAPTQYEKLIPDYNFGTMLRPDATREYDERNSMFVTRTQFYAIEVSPHPPLPACNC